MESFVSNFEAPVNNFWKNPSPPFPVAAAAVAPADDPEVEEAEEEEMLSEFISAAAGKIESTDRKNEKMKEVVIFEMGVTGRISKVLLFIQDLL